MGRINPNHQAIEHGVSPGWTILAIDGQKVGNDAEKINQILKNRSKKPLKIRFNTSQPAAYQLRRTHGEEPQEMRTKVKPYKFKIQDTSSQIQKTEHRTIVFDPQKPWGFDLANNSVAIVRPNSQAKSLNIKPGWTITKIGDVPVTENATSERILKSHKVPVPIIFSYKLPKPSGSEEIPNASGSEEIPNASDSEEKSTNPDD